VKDDAAQSAADVALAEQADTIAAVHNLHLSPLGLFLPRVVEVQPSTSARARAHPEVTLAGIAAAFASIGVRPPRHPSMPLMPLMPLKQLSREAFTSALDEGIRPIATVWWQRRPIPTYRVIVDGGDRPESKEPRRSRGPYLCRIHDDCRQNPALAGACWEDQRSRSPEQRLSKREARRRWRGAIYSRTSCSM
jgi:hypothetical protein